MYVCMVSCIVHTDRQHSSLTLRMYLSLYIQALLAAGLIEEAIRSFHAASVLRSSSLKDKRQVCMRVRRLYHAKGVDYDCDMLTYRCIISSEWHLHKGHPYDR